MSHADAPIGVFDSGVGGLSVWREIVRLLPHEDTVYVADSAHCPYGARPAAEICQLSEAVASFLVGQGCKILVVACNTASAAALYHLRAAFDVPIVGMVPAVKPAVAQTHTGQVGVLATGVTLNGQLFHEVHERFANDITVHSVTCPGLVELVEAGRADAPETEVLLRHCLQPLLDAGIDVLALGCTHYPFLTPAIRRIAGPDLLLLDPSAAIARQTGRVLRQSNLLADRARPGQHTFLSTGLPAALASFLQDTLGLTQPIDIRSYNSP
ncbi:MAG: glutamate racemase [Chloroflexi bacterium]|nr:glutamate racemase [Chloroflexota bacterium]MBU1746087.1 glutamate racemase [Chloroflexota bacterium]